MRVKRHPTVWTPNRVSTLEAMYRDGETDAAIALALGTTRNAIRVRRHHLGLVCRKLSRKSIRDYTTGALLMELTRRLGPLPGTLWSRERKLDPKMAGGIITF
jgi:hypothetical protein